jgi:hypothetical protein
MALRREPHGERERLGLPWLGEDRTAFVAGKAGEI